MKRAAKTLALALALATAAAPSAWAASEPDLLTQMFTWWNGAFSQPGAYTPEAFRKYFTEDAQLVIDGRVSARGVQGWADHFQKIQAGGGVVEIVLPFREEFQTGDKIFTYHIIRAVRGGVLTCQLAAGYALVRDHKLAMVNLVRSNVDPSKGPTDPACEAPKP
jgi:hypothetical protein